MTSQKYMAREFYTAIESLCSSLENSRFERSLVIVEEKSKETVKDNERKMSVD